jgi:hypothetical protein
MDKMEHILQANPDATIGEYWNTYRLCDVPHGADVRHMGRMYKVLRSDRGITMKQHHSSNPGSNVQFGLNCQMWVEVVPVKKKPQRMMPAPHYSNRSPYGIASTITADIK